MERVDAALTPQQYRMLKLIGAGGERSARLAERLAVAKPTLTSTADGLVAAGLVSREPETSDRRVVRLWLTEAGQRAVDLSDEVYAQWLGELLQLAGDPDQLLRGFDLLDHAIDQRRDARAAVGGGEAGQTAGGTGPAGRDQAGRSISPRKKAQLPTAQAARRSSM